MSFTASSVGAEGASASADGAWLSAGEGLFSNRGDSAGVLPFVASAARKSSSDLRPNQSDPRRSLDEEVGLGCFSRKAKLGSSGENLRDRMKCKGFFFLKKKETSNHK